VEPVGWVAGDVVDVSDGDVADAAPVLVAAAAGPGDVPGVASSGCAHPLSARPAVRTVPAARRRAVRGLLRRIGSSARVCMAP